MAHNNIPILALLIDDEQMQLDYMTDVLEDSGFQVVSYSAGIDAVTAFSFSPERFAMVITDLEMPGLTGTEVASKIRSISPQVPILLHSGNIQTLPESEIDEDPFAARFKKPASLSSLISTIESLIQARAESYKNDC